MTSSVTTITTTVTAKIERFTNYAKEPNNAPDDTFLDGREGVSEPRDRILRCWDIGRERNRSFAREFLETRPEKWPDNESSQPRSLNGKEGGSKLME